MTGFIVSVFPFRNRVSATEAFEGLELGEGKTFTPSSERAGWPRGARLLRIGILALNPFRYHRVLNG